MLVLSKWYSDIPRGRLDCEGQNDQITQREHQEWCMICSLIEIYRMYRTSNSLQTRVYRVQLIAFLFSKAWLQTQSRETRHFTQQYAGQCNISPWYMCLTVIRGQVVSVPSTPEFFFWLNVRLGGTGLLNIERRRKNTWSYIDRRLKQPTTGILLIKWINGLNNRLLER